MALTKVKTTVLGAGVVGVATAWMLCRAGHQVTLVDKHAGPARGASQANGAQLSYAYGDALASPSMLAHLPGIALGLDPAYRVRIQADPHYLMWGLKFLLNSTPGRFLANTGALLRTAARTRQMLGEIQQELDLAFDYAASGKMILYASVAACNAGIAVRKLKYDLGIPLSVLNRAEATAIEPALALYPDPIERVVYSPDDAAGRPDMFCEALVDVLKKRYAFTTVFGQQAEALLTDRGQVTGLAFADREPLACDMLVMATGCATALLPWRDQSLGGIWPVQGYSITAPATAAAMHVSITDVSRKIVFARVGSDIRAAGLADITSRDCLFDAKRFESFRAAAVDAFGQTFAHGPEQNMRPWSGGRPCTPSSQPIVRAGSLRGLYLNLGHGTLGWTLGLGSAAQLCEIIERTQD